MSKIKEIYENHPIFVVATIVIVSYTAGIATSEYLHSFFDTRQQPVLPQVQTSRIEFDRKK